jgi:diaminohydroxyphosphoribosylaminopyrimidine deaminase/5-amino-6-(5-phosphoribosylamino)uracil reductase
VHKWRSEEQAILVGTQTVIDDNPKLNIRDWSGNSPARIVLDQNNRITTDSFIFDNSIKTIVFTKSETSLSTENTTFEVINFKQNIIPQILDVLHQNQIQSVIIEGGSQTLQTFIEQNIWDEARIFKGKNIFNRGIKAPVIAQKNTTKTYIQNDELIYIRNYD